MKKALVVVDMQNDFLTGVLGNQECSDTIPEVVDLLKKADEYDGIFVTKDTHQENYLETQEGKNLPVVHCVEGTKGWELDERIREVLPEKSRIICKPTFGSVELAKELEGYDEADVAGVCTGICVISNVMVMKAFSPELKVNVIERATACVTPESKQTALEAMKTCQVNII